MLLVLIVVGIMALVMLAMAVGLMLKGQCLRGSCGGPDILGPNGESLLCATCPQREESTASG